MPFLAARSDAPNGLVATGIDAADDTGRALTVRLLRPVCQSINIARS
jgi:hypothetical protein